VCYTSSMNTTQSAARLQYGEAARRFRSAQARFDATRELSTEYVEAQDALAAAYDRWLAVRGY
jgi:hypothetical protein